MPEPVSYTFPSTFLWGTAASSHQVEGGNTNNDWWEWEQRGKIKDGSRSGAACDQYHRFAQDFSALKKQHHNTHRLSLEWSRIEPEAGRWDKSAIAHYKQVIHSLKSKGLVPMVTLHHFTNPLWLMRMGGWENPGVVGLFARYARFAARELGENVDLWITINEPIVYAYESYISGIWPPGKNDFGTAMRVIRHMLSAHAAAYHAVHDVLGRTCRVGFAKHCRVLDPYRGGSFFDRLLSLGFDFIFNRLFTAACIHGVIPPPAAFFRRVRRLRNTTDFIGINYYTRELIKFDLTKADSLFISLFTRPGAKVNSLGWEFYPRGLYRFLQSLKKYRKPVYITENGTCTADDTERCRFIVAHLRQVHRAISRGIDVRGYYYWSCLDNFEWAEGFTPRFGLMEVEYTTQRRTLRGSGRLYAEIARSGGITTEMIRRFG
ncbi:MAG: glycoside hydrolase family 1 protein [Spirochaetia bacterium]